MRITCVLGPWVPVPLLRGGSVERIWLNLCEEFAARGHTVTLISRKFDGMPTEEIVNGVRYLRLFSFGAPKNKILYRLVDLLFSLVVCQSLPESDLTITNSVSLPLIIPRSRAGRIYMSLARFPKGQMGFYRRVDRIQPVSTHVGDAVKLQSPAVAPLIKVIPNAISEVFTAGLGQRREPRAKQIIYVGRIAKEKGIELLIRGFATIQARHPDWKLIVVGPHLPSQGGDGERFLAELKREASRTQASVSFVGPIFDEAELRRRLNDSEIFVYPSIAARGEALPLAPVEAMACGCAALVSSLDCFNDYLVPGVNGLAFDQSDGTGSDLGRKLETLIDDEALRAEIGRAAVSTAKTYTREAVAGQFLDDFRSVLNNRSGTGS